MDKFHKNQRKKELQKNKQKRAELTKIKHANQSAQAINLELLRLQKLPNSAPVLHREQKVKALAKALSERIEKGERVTEDEEGVGRTGKKKDGFVGPNSNNSNGVKQIEWERDLRDVYRAEDSVYFHPTLNPLGKPPPGKPQKYVARKREGKVDVGRALPAPGERGGGDSSSSSDDDEDDADGNFFTRNREGVYKVEAIPGPPKGAPPPEIVMNDDDDNEASKYDDGEVLPPPIEPPPGWMPKPPPGTPPSTAFEEEDLEEVEEDDLEAIPPPPPDDDDDEEDMTVAPAPPPPPPPPPQNQTILDLEEKKQTNSEIWEHVRDDGPFPFKRAEREQQQQSDASTTSWYVLSATTTTDATAIDDDDDGRPTTPSAKATLFLGAATDDSQKNDKGSYNKRQSYGYFERFRKPSFTKARPFSFANSKKTTAASGCFDSRSKIEETKNRRGAEDRR